MDTAGAVPTAEYHFERGPQGTPRFFQILRWDGDPDVLFYEVTVETKEGEPVSMWRIEEPELRLELSPGDYRWQIVLYNVLRQPEVALPWQDLEILEAKTPALAEASPKIWFLEEGTFDLALAGENLLPGAAVVLRREDSPAERICGAEVGTNAGTARYRFPGPAPTPGLYALEVTNPGGLSCSLPQAVLVRPQLAAATELRPAPGTRLGPADLRDQRFLDFSWAPVTEASQYRFVLRRRSDAQVILQFDELQEPHCRLDDLALLDRGDFEWTVEAQGTDPSRGPLPAVSPSRADFGIDLPTMTAPAVRSGDTFYGR